jgi:hypothetical protein
MPLLDHFHPPLSLRRSWHAFHNSWATYLSADLNRRLPAGYFAAANVQFEIEIDVTVLEENDTDGGIGWSGAGPSLSIPLALLTDSVEVQIFATEEGPTLAGAIELVSPRNKDRANSRAAFVSKCASFLQSGIGLIIVDVVTSRLADLHAELLQRLDYPDVTPVSGGLYAVAYHPLRRDGEPRLDIWHSPLTVGESLPTLPFWIRGGPCLGVDLEASYERTRQEQRVNLEGVAT